MKHAIIAMAALVAVGMVAQIKPKTQTDQLLINNEAYAYDYDKAGLPIPPSKGVAAVVCMDARLETGRMLGVEEGDIHVIRNAGGVVTDDVLRSLTISQRLLGTTEIMLVHHEDCGMRTFDDDPFKEEIYMDTGIKPRFAMESFDDPAEDVRQSAARIENCPFVPIKTELRGFVFDEQTGLLHEVPLK